jgi:hypothetical protein
VVPVASRVFFTVIAAWSIVIDCRALLLQYWHIATNSVWFALSLNGGVALFILLLGSLFLRQQFLIATHPLVRGFDVPNIVELVLAG